MKKINLMGVTMKLLLILTLTFLAGCHSGWDKDPFANDADKIKNAITPDTKIEKIPPPEQNTLYSSLSRVYSVQEGEQLPIFIEYKIAHPEVKLTNIIIKDLDKIFPDSSFDFQTKKLFIRPGFETVPADLDYVTKTLEIIFETAYENKTFSVSYEIAVLVLPMNTEPPVIVKIPYGTIPTKMSVGGTYNFKLEVKDSNNEYSPRVQAFDRLINTGSGSQYVKISPTGVQSPSNPNIWIFDVELKFPSDMQVKTSGVYNYVELIAYSVSGIPSRGESLMMNVYPVARPPSFLTKKVFYIRKDKPFDYLFAVVDEYNVGTVFTSCPSVPMDFKCSCENSMTVGEPSQCRLNWTPNQAGEFTLKWEATNIVQQGYAGATTKATQLQEIKIIVQ